MKLKKRIPSPSVLPVDIVWWTDAAHGERQVMDTELLRNATVGWIAYEDDQIIILAHEVVAEDNWRERESDWTQIPKSLVVKRWTLGQGHIYGDVEDGA